MAQDTPPEDPDSQAADAVARYDELARQLDELLEALPADERPAAAAAVYFDGDGRVRTRHRMLGVVPDEE